MVAICYSTCKMFHSVCAFTHEHTCACVCIHLCILWQKVIFLQYINSNYFFNIFKSSNISGLLFFSFFFFPLAVSAAKRKCFIHKKPWILFQILPLAVCLLGFFFVWKSKLFLHNAEDYFLL